MFQLPQHSNNELAFIAYLSCCLQPSIWQWYKKYQINVST
jgi:hypothetical protein